jgi:hypothetical protein
VFGGERRRCSAGSNRTFLTQTSDMTRSLLSSNRTITQSGWIMAAAGCTPGCGVIRGVY